jgi:hypothetical protein
VPVAPSMKTRCGRTERGPSRAILLPEVTAGGMRGPVLRGGGVVVTATGSVRATSAAQRIRGCARLANPAGPALASSRRRIYEVKKRGPVVRPGLQKHHQGGDRWGPGCVPRQWCQGDFRRLRSGEPYASTARLPRENSASRVRRIGADKGLSPACVTGVSQVMTGEGWIPPPLKRSLRRPCAWPEP